MPSPMNRMYGDIVMVLLLIPALFAAVHKWLAIDRTQNFDVWCRAAQVVLSLAVTTSFFVASTASKNGSLVYSWCGYVSNLVALSLLDLVGWPIAVEPGTTFARFLFSFVLVHANVGLPLPHKLAQSAFALTVGVLVTHYSPHTLDFPAKEAFALLALLQGIVLALIHFGKRFELVTMHGARAVLAAVFFYHTWEEMHRIIISDVSPTAGALTVFKAGVVASVGLAAAGAFRDNIQDRERAEYTAQQENLRVETMKESIECVSHEMRTPMQGIMGTVSLLLNKDDTGDPLSEDTRESLSIVMASAGLLLTLINNMLDVRKCDANMMSKFALSDISLLSSINDALTFSKPLAFISNVHLKMEPASLSKTSTFVRADTLRLQQVLINLISNAVKYTSKGSTVEVSARISTLGEVQTSIQNALANGGEQPDWAQKHESAPIAVISVSDQGRGIPPEECKKLFKRFSQLTQQSTHKLGGNSVGQPSGTGLGLSLCVKFVHLMGGNIWVTNNPEGGAKFSFGLPSASSSDSADELSGSATRKPSSERTPSSLLSEYRVLLVDDTMINRKVFKRMLVRIGVGLAVTAESGDRALELLQEQEFDLMITDIQMPGMSGFELTEKVRDEEIVLKKKPLVVGLTAETSSDLNIRCASCGMANVLHKPITVVELQEYLENSALVS